jgi:uncharacterized damage-inducible protein DinB
MTGYEPPAYFLAVFEDEGAPVEELIEAYREGSSWLRELVAGMDADTIRARPVEGAWSTLEALCHIADCEQFLSDRMKRTVATDLPLLLGVDGGGYLEALHYQDRDPGLELRLIEVTREQMAADLGRLPAEAWERTAIHSEVGRVTLRQLLLHSIRHIERHGAAIVEKRRVLGLDG